MWQPVLFVAGLLTLLVGMLLAAYEKLRPSRVLRLCGGGLALLAAVALVPVVVDRALDGPVLWPFVALMVGGLAFGAVMFRRDLRSPAPPAGGGPARELIRPGDDEWRDGRAAG